MPMQRYKPEQIVTVLRQEELSREENRFNPVSGLPIFGQ